MPNPKPFVVHPPGATIAEELEARNMSLADFAHAMGLTEEIAQHLIDGTLYLGEVGATKLECLFGASAQFWLNLEARWKEHLNERNNA